MHITQNRKGLFLVIFLIAGGLLFLGCGTYVWVTVKEKPGIPVLAATNSLGIGQFDIIIQGNPHALERIDNSTNEWSIVGGQSGTMNKANVIIQAPDAASHYEVNETVLSRIVQENLSGWLSGKKSFKMSAVTGLRLEKVTDQDDLGTQAQDLPLVVNIPQVVDSLMENEQMVSLGSQYNVDLILGGEVKVTAQILEATDKLNEGSITSGDAPLKEEGEYGLYLDISFDYGLYDAKSGALITDSRKTNTKYVNPSLIDNKVIGLTSVPAGNQTALKEFLNSPTYVKLYEDRLTKLLVNYIYLFRSHYRSFQQKVEK